ncbi:MAG: alpha/beta fold hydrolase [Minwuiales bacterium]|nr:alpha/beta fold hydrolase [Minwuiales bacterium]
MPYLDRDGVRIFYEAEGDGPPVLLSHGYSATSRMWDAQTAHLKDRYRVIRWDFRGHGESDYPDDQAAYSETATVADMAAILDACDVDRAVVGGLSLGGYMSLAFNLKHAARVRALMLFDTGPGFKKDAARDAWNENAMARADKLETQGLAALSSSREVMSSTHRDATGLARAARGMLTQRDASVIQSLPAIAVPTLVLVGADDAPFLGATEYMAGKIPQSTHVVIPDAGHAANLDQPAAFNRAVDAFLGGLAA